MSKSGKWLTIRFFKTYFSVLNFYVNVLLGVTFGFHVVHIKNHAWLLISLFCIIFLLSNFTNKLLLSAVNTFIYFFFSSIWLDILYASISAYKGLRFIIHIIFLKHEVLTYYFSLIISSTCHRRSERWEIHWLMSMFQNTFMNFCLILCFRCGSAFCYNCGVPNSSNLHYCSSCRR